MKLHLFTSVFCLLTQYAYFMQKGISCKENNDGKHMLKKWKYNGRSTKINKK